MKKLSIFVGALTLTTSMFAQDLTSKKGENFLPETGDWSLGIDATPFLNYFGNFIGGNGLNVAPTFDFSTGNQTIFGKYFVSEKMAYRGSLRIGFGSDKEVNIVDKRGDDDGLVFYPSIPATVENKGKMGTSNFGLAGGLEWRKGTTRLQGFYGAELGFSTSSMKNTYEYGNGLVSFNAAAPVTDVNVDAAADAMFAAANITADTYGNDARVLESKMSTFSLGLRGFVGVEYFVIPKLSIGGEFGWGLAMNSMKSSKSIESEGNDVNGFEVKGTQDTETGKVSTFGFDTDHNNSVFGPAGKIKILFHF